MKQYKHLFRITQVIEAESREDALNKFKENINNGQYEIEES